MKKIENVNAFIAAERELLLKHPLYHKISKVSDLQKFTEGHVYAVWDFMSLLKALQIKLTCVEVPWFASAMPNTRYLINEIVLAEESDEYIDGRRLSHFEMYLDAMAGMEADTTVISHLIQAIQQRLPVVAAIDQLPVDERIKDFLRFSFSVIEEGETHKIAAAFTFGREDLIPDMFTSILNGIQSNAPQTDLSKFIYYFQRHIELDGDEHGPLAMQMILELGGEDEVKWQEMMETAKEALVKRLALWDAIEESLAH
ncbi:DUF3050 domain-containing protein [Sphingobacterium oryzagri]|uniref:DUF3050 domain-containing protein n=1 Tax=Sphingobacterium oryzagri TaxID=3025669 RepID=A0ABY7WK23_9SPHI|nr:DUF3050 domain-containing protein [Sphingobacterium sp. KACC 22765]WDF69937.1 DUF3050 domain-containing protein [Sphingobacterium sp. KACC 22765]